MADTNWNFLNYEGLEYYDSKSEVRTDEKIAVETERAKKAEKNNATSINNEVIPFDYQSNALRAIIGTSYAIISVAGLEPATPRIRGELSNQLSYTLLLSEW